MCCRLLRKVGRGSCTLLMGLLALPTAIAGEQDLTKDRVVGDLDKGVRIQADGKPIDIGQLSNIAHAGPCVADVDGDGDRDLLVGDFPGFFWFFENTANDEKPEYTSKGKLQAGGVDAKTPVY